jgi:predicted ribosomally synthesized peptide with SipW-like signal peptide
MRRKTLITGSLLIAVLLSAAVGGAYAVFTDTEAMHVEFEAGTINIALNGEDNLYQEFALNPEGYDDWKPGDQEEFPIVIDNIGTNKAWIQVYVYPTGPWTEGAADLWEIAKYQVTGPGEWNQWLVEPGESITLNLEIDFPQEAGNKFQGAQADLLVLVVAKQWRNKLEEGYWCVALEDKDPDNGYLPDLSNDLEGVICYKWEEGELRVDLNAYGLQPGVFYQLDLTGGDMNSPIDGACTAQDDNFAGMSSDIYVAGYWNWGTYLEVSCNAGNGGEGVYNYAGVYGEVQADEDGAISFGGSLPLPAFPYDGVGAHVKEIVGEIPGSNWPVILSEMDYLSFGP